MTETTRPDYYKVKVNGRLCDDTSGPLTRGSRVRIEVECFDVIDALGLGFYLGNALKYIWRAGRKTRTKVTDLGKAHEYISQEILRAPEDLPF